MPLIIYIFPWSSIVQRHPLIRKISNTISLPLFNSGSLLKSAGENQHEKEEWGGNS